MENLEFQGSIKVGGLDISVKSLPGKATTQELTNEELKAHWDNLKTQLAVIEEEIKRRGI